MRFLCYVQGDAFTHRTAFSGLGSFGWEWGWVRWVVVSNEINNPRQPNCSSQWCENFKIYRLNGCCIRNVFKDFILHFT